MELKEYRNSLFRKIYHFFIFSTIILGILEIYDSRYFLGFIFVLIAPIILFVPRNLYKIKSVRKNYNANAVLLMEAFLLIILINGISELKYDNDIFDYDSLNHFVNPLLITILIGLLYTLLNYEYREKINNKKIAGFSLIATIALVLLWEPFELLIDFLFKTKLVYDKFQSPFLDTSLDIAFGISGSLLGFFIIKNYWHYLVEKFKNIKIKNREKLEIMFQRIKEKRKFKKLMKIERKRLKKLIKLRKENENI
jgi:hypothetical protein